MSNSLKPHEALSCVAEIKKILLQKGQWLNVTEQYDSNGLKFIKIECSVKVKQ